MQWSPLPHYFVQGWPFWDKHKNIWQLKCSPTEFWIPPFLIVCQWIVLCTTWQFVQLKYYQSHWRISINIFPCRAVHICVVPPSFISTSMLQNKGMISFLSSWVVYLFVAIPGFELHIISRFGSSHFFNFFAVRLLFLNCML